MLCGRRLHRCFNITGGRPLALLSAVTRLRSSGSAFTCGVRPTAAARCCATAVDRAREHPSTSSQPPSASSRQSGIREALAVASGFKYDLVAVLRLLESGALPRYCVVLQFPRPRAANVRGRLFMPMEIVVLRDDARASDIAVFGDGTVVSFGATASELSQLNSDLESCRADRDDVAWSGQPDCIHRRRYTVMADLAELGFEAPSDVTTSYIDEGALDAVVLLDESLESKLPFMFVLSRRVQIDALKQALQPVMEAVRTWRREVGANGSLPVEIRQARMRHARVMRLAAAQVRIGSRPRIFTDGDFVHLRHMYGMCTYYFELTERNDALRARIDTTVASLKYLGDEAKARTDHRLEWVIIALLVVEILIHLVPHRTGSATKSSETVDASSQQPMCDEKEDAAVPAP